MEKMGDKGKNGKYFEDISNFYRVALKHYISMHTEKKFKTDFFKKLNEEHPNISFSNLSNFINRKAPLSEKKRIQIASFLGFYYEEFITLGRKLVSLQKNNAALRDPGPDFFYLNRSTSKIFMELQGKYNLSDRNIANYLNIDTMDYQFKKKGLIPFSFDEIAIVFEKAGQTNPNLVHAPKNPPKKKKVISQTVDEIKKMSLEEKEVIKKLLENDNEIDDNFIEKLKLVKKLIETDDNI